MAYLSERLRTAVSNILSHKKTMALEAWQSSQQSSWTCLLPRERSLLLVYGTAFQGVETTLKLESGK